MEIQCFHQTFRGINELIEGLDEPYVSLKASELKFLSLEYDAEIQKFDIIIYLKNYNLHCDTKTWNQALFIIIKDLLGEKSVCHNINYIQLALMPDNEEELI